MNLAPDWKRLLRYAWSIRLIVVAAVLDGLALILPLFVDAFPRTEFAVLSMVVTIAAGVARVTAQPQMERREPVKGDRRKASRPNPDYKAADYD